MTETLRECPFCSESDDALDTGWRNPHNWSHVRCTQCGALGPSADYKTFAIAAWNRRTPPPIPEAVKTAYREARKAESALRLEGFPQGAEVRSAQAGSIRETLRTLGYDLSELE